MATAVEILGIFGAIFFGLSAIEIVLLLQVLLLEDNAKRLITWIWKHGGFTSLNAMRAHYARGGMPVSHADILGVIESVTDIDKSDWSKEPSLLTEDDAMNEENMSTVLQNMNQKRNEAIKKKQLQKLYQERNTIDRAMQKCQMMLNGQVMCEPANGTM